MAPEVFETDGSTVQVHVGSATEEVQAPITVEALKEIAKRYGIGRFVVKDSTGRLLDSSDFPYDGGDIRIEQYNEAKAL